MKTEQVLLNVEIYRKLLEASGLKPKKFPRDMAVSPEQLYWEALAHLLTELENIRNLIGSGERGERGESDERDLAFVKLGFVQGVLWSASLRSLAEVDRENGTQ